MRIGISTGQTGRHYLAGSVGVIGVTRCSNYCGWIVLLLVSKPSSSLI